MNIKLTKIELEFLIALLDVELDLKKRDLRRHLNSKTISKELRAEEKLLNSILNKLTKEQ
tara:strand:- start:22 stop:201 length:180 start_codon:yes stop_codon:yes gene_type:complete